MGHWRTRKGDRRRVQTETRWMSAGRRRTKQERCVVVVGSLTSGGGHVYGGGRPGRASDERRWVFVGGDDKGWEGDILCTRRTARRKACRLSSVARTAEARRVPGLTCNVSRKSANICLEGCNEATHKAAQQSIPRATPHSRAHQTHLITTPSSSFVRFVFFIYTHT